MEENSQLRYPEHHWTARTDDPDLHDLYWARAFASLSLAYERSVPHRCRAGVPSRELLHGPWRRGHRDRLVRGDK